MILHIEHLWIWSVGFIQYPQHFPTHKSLCELRSTDTCLHRWLWGQAHVVLLSVKLRLPFQWEKGHSLRRLEQQLTVMLLVCFFLLPFPAWVTGSSFGQLESQILRVRSHGLLNHPGLVFFLNMCGPAYVFPSLQARGWQCLWDHSLHLQTASVTWRGGYMTINVINPDRLNDR